MAEFEAIGKALQIPQSVLNNIEKIDQKINLIASDSEKMAKVFTSAMTRMGTGADGLLKKLQAMQSTISKLDISKFAQGVQNVGRGSTQVEQFASAIAKAADAINKYNKENRERANVDNSKQIAQLNKEIETLKKRTKQLDEYIEKLKQANQGGGRSSGRNSSGINSDVKAMNAYNRAMSASEALVTQRINKIAKLRQAEEMLRNASSNYATQLNRISQEIARLNRLNEGQVDSYGRVIRSQRQLVNTSEQLTRQLALVFSVSAIEGYIMKLIQVRGEFELQQTALASILQNKDKADQLFGQITELAVKSPFTLKELTTYTKSLAAYQVQYEDLYDTTKMLADVSAGLGVDMQRLILAFGQVKAANILRGTEVRQFTEAGLNILGELAKYYSELEGRMISVGEVQDMVTKRMVSFGDVEEVFKRITSAGGIFYDMQERQSQTLAGMMSNLRDNLDLMFNDIGKSNDSVIKDVVKTIADLIKNWREVAWYVEKVAVAFVAYKSVVALAALGNSQFVKTLFQISTMSGTATTRIKALGKALAPLGRGLAVGGIILLVSWLTDLVREATRAQRESERLSKELKSLTSIDAGTLEKTVQALDDLLARYKLSNEGSQERRDIISALNSNYGEYLNFIVDETTTLEQLTLAYDDVIKRMKERASLSTLEKGYQEINQAYEEQISKGREQLEKELSKGIRVKVGAGFTKNLLPTEEDINNIFNLLQQRIRESNEEELKGSREQRNLLQEIVTKYYDDKDLYLSQDYMKTIPLIDAFIQKKEKEAELESNINSTYKQTMQTREANLAMQERELRYEEEKKRIQSTPLSSFETQRQLQEASKQYELDKIDIQLQFGEISEASAKRAKDAIIHWATATTEDINKNLREKLSEFTEEDISRVLVTPEVQSQGVTSLIQETITQYKAQNSIIEQQEQLKEAGLRIDENVLENAKKLLAMYKARGEVLGVDWSALESGKGGGSQKNTELDKLKEQVAMIEKAAKAYEDYRKLYDEETAKRMVETAFEKPFDNLDLNFDMTFDAQGIIAAYRQLAQSVGGDAQEYIEGKIAEGLTDVTTEQRTKEVEEYRKQIDELFASLSNYQELEKLGLNKDLISQLFGINVSSINDVQDIFEKIKTELKKYGNEGEKLIAEAEKKITDAQQKELENRLKKFADYISEYSDDTKRIMYESGENIGFANLLFNEGKINSDEYVEIIRNIVRDTNDELSKINLDKFQRSSEYIQAMGDLSLYSKRQLQDLSNKLKDVIAQSSKTMSPEDIDEYYDALGRINSQMEKISENTPWENTPISKITRLIKAQQDFSNAQQTYKKHEDDKNTYENKLKLLQQQLEVYKAQQQTAKSGSAEAMALQKNIADTQGQIGNIMQLVSGAESGMASASTTMSAISSSFGGAVGGAAGAIAVVDAIVKGVYQSINATIEMFYEIKDLAESFGANVDEGAWENMSIAASYISEMNEQVMGSWESFKSGDMIGASVKAFQAVSSVIQGFNAIHDNKREQKIRKELELLDDLEYAYEKLEKAVEDAYSLDTLKKTTENAEENLLNQRKALQNSIALENDKKKKDEDRIKEWQRQIDDINEQLDELEKEKFSKATSGILDDVLSAADEFTNAWLESFREVGDGMDGLNENFQSMLEDMLKRQASMLITGTYLDRWKRELEKYINADDLELTAGEAKNWVDAVTSSLPGLNQALEEYFKAMQQAGFDLTGKGEGDTLTGLQRGIEGLSEQTGQALEALLESCRYFISDSNIVLHNFYNAFQTPNEENPFLAELRNQTSLIQSINSTLSRLTRNATSNGLALKVQIV